MGAGQDRFEFFDDFFGAGTFLASPVGSDTWDITDTSAAGTPTYAYVDGALSGEVALDFDSQSEAQNVCLSMRDILQFGIDELLGVEWRVKMNQAAVDSTTSVAIGMAGDRNDAIDSIAQTALFRVIGADSTTAVVVETDDGTNNNDDVATGETLINAYKRLRISFAKGTADVRFFMDDSNGALKQVATATTFDMSNYTGALQPYVQIQKTADTNTDGLTIDYCHIWGNR
jgi:hypothetical protein